MAGLRMGAWNVGLRKLNFTYRFRVTMKGKGGKMGDCETPGEANEIGLVEDGWDLNLR